MDIKSNHSTSVLTDAPPISKSRLGIHSSLLPYSPGSTLSSGMYIVIPKKKANPSNTYKLEDVRCMIDSMLLSSPPRKKLTKDPNSEVATEDSQLYRSWMLKYPSALDSFEQIMNYAKGKRIALFLDYDGTLSPIVDDPERAFMSNAMRSAVKNVAKFFPTAIISGRSRDKVYEFVELTELYYAGSHGMDIMGPVRKLGNDDNNSNCIRSSDKQGKEVNLFQPASEFIPMINEVFSSLVEISKGIEGSKIEDNKFCVSVHYRNVDERYWSIIGQSVTDLLKGYPRLRLTHGRKVLEIRPVIDWDKGKAVEFLLDSLGLNDCDDVLSMYIGDDRTDEDAFKVLRERNQGYGILVSSMPKESNAFYSLKEPSEVMKFLKLLAKVGSAREIKLGDRDM